MELGLIRGRISITASAYTSMFFLGIVIAVVGVAARNIGLKPSQIGFLISIQNIGFVIGVMVAGTLSDTKPKSLIMLSASVLLSVAFFTFYASDIFVLNTVIMFAMGCGIGVYEGTSDALLLEIHSKNESLHINVNHSFVTLGSLMVTIYLIFLQMSWRRSMIQASVAVACLAVVFALMKRKRPVGSSSRLIDRLKVFAFQPSFIFLFVLLLVATGAQMSGLGIMTTYLMQIHNHDQVTSKIIAVLFLSGMGVGRIAIGFLTRSGRIYRFLLILYGSTTVFSFLFFSVGSGPVSYLLALLMGLTVSGLMPLALTSVGLIFRDVAGTALGLVKFAIPLGGIIVPLLFSAASEIMPLRGAVLTMPVLFSVGSILTALSRRFLLSEHTR